MPYMQLQKQEKDSRFKCSYTSLVEIEKIVPNPKNNNRHTVEQIERLAKIINFQGMRSPIVISNRSGFVVKGHCRLEAVKKLGWEKIAVDYQDYENEAIEYADMTADNEIARWAELDYYAFKNDSKELDLEGIELDLFGLRSFEIDDKDLDYLEGDERIGEWGDRYNDDSVTIKLMFEKERWDEFKKKPLKIIEDYNLGDISELFTFLVEDFCKRNP